MIVMPDQLGCGFFRGTMPEPLQYATPDLNRRPPTTDGIPLATAVIQLILAVPLLVPIVYGYRPWSTPDFSAHWYERPAQVWVSPNVLDLVYIAGSCIVIIGAVSSGDRRSRFYRLYVKVWVSSLALTIICLLFLAPWPGELRHRWVLVHNLHSTFVEADALFQYVQTFLVLNPALLFLVIRRYFRRV
jgi:hypothetical protein